MYGLADCNNFFVSCERVFNPSLNGKPVIVLSNNDGCAVSRSNEAKALGIKMGAPLFQIQDIVLKNNVTVFSSNFALYGDMSNRVHSILRGMVPAIEIYSIDEAFLDLHGMNLSSEGFDTLAKAISKKCFKCTGIPVSVGIAPTKTLAKIASKLCKQYPKLQGGCFMHRPEDIEKVLRRFPIGNVWGIGRKFSKRLMAFGVNTAYDFSMMNPERVQREMGKPGLNTWRELRGEECIKMETEVADKQQICISRSFAKEIFDFDELSEQVSLFAGMTCEKLRHQKSACHHALVFVLTNRHKIDVPQQFEGKMITFPVATDSTLEINKSVLETLSMLFRKGYGYKKAGVILSGIIPAIDVQPDLFDTLDRPKHTKLMKTIDAINAQNGTHTLCLGSQTLDGIKMNRNHLSQCYTTKWSEILRVKAE